MPWETKLTTSIRAMFCFLSTYTAWLSCSENIATSTLAPVTSFLPEDCTWNTARCSTRWKPSVGCVSRSLCSSGMSGVVELMKSCRSDRNLSRLAPQARSTSAAEALSSNASSRCSTVMNSWRLERATVNAVFRVSSSSLLSMAVPLSPLRACIGSFVVRHLQHRAQTPSLQVPSLNKRLFQCFFTMLLQYHSTTGADTPAHTD